MGGSKRNSPGRSGSKNGKRTASAPHVSSAPYVAGHGYRAPAPVTNAPGNKYYCERIFYDRPGQLADPLLPSQLKAEGSRPLYVPPQIPANSKKNHYYSQDFITDTVHNNASIHINPRDPVCYADEMRGPKHYNQPLFPLTDKRWGWNQEQKAEEKIPKRIPLKQEEVEKYRTFEEYKNSQTFEEFNPGLFREPHKVYPGRLHGKAFGSFDWWKSEPEFDWWNVSNQQRDTFFRKEPRNARSLDPVGMRDPLPSRERVRVPSVGKFLNDRALTRGEIEAERKRQSKIPLYKFEGEDVKKGFVPLVRKFVPAVPRFPLEVNERNQLMQSFGPFKALETVRGQVTDARFVEYNGSARKGGMWTGRSESTSARSGSLTGRSGSERVF